MFVRRTPGLQEIATRSLIRSFVAPILIRSWELADRTGSFRRPNSRFAVRSH